VLEDLRTRALRSESFTEGTVKLLLTLVGGADRLQADNPNFAVFEQHFTDAGFEPAHIDDSWALNAYDAMTTISEALRTPLPANKPIQRSQVNTAISGFFSAGLSVPGAGGPITFDNSGNRTGRPPVVRLCPLLAASGDQPSRTTTVAVHPGEPTAHCAQ
jgi:ABC-type branched-subunit amino acid transport system substrate-binding protein